MESVPTNPTETFRRKFTFYPRGESCLPKFRSLTPMWVSGLLFIVANPYLAHFAPELSEELALGSVIVGGFAIFTVMGAALVLVRNMWGLCMAAALTTLVIHLLGFSMLSVLLTVGAVVGLLMCKEEFE